MKFKIVKQLKAGQFHCGVYLEDFTTEDNEKALKFGFPLLSIKVQNGKSFSIPVTQLAQFQTFGFADAKSADAYIDDLKKQIELLKNNWTDLKDKWSGDEII